MKSMGVYTCSSVFRYVYIVQHKEIDANGVNLQENMIIIEKA